MPAGLADVPTNWNSRIQEVPKETVPAATSGTPGLAGPSPWLPWACGKAHARSSSTPSPASARMAPARGDFVRLPPCRAEKPQRGRWSEPRRPSRSRPRVMGRTCRCQTPQHLRPVIPMLLPAGRPGVHRAQPSAHGARLKGFPKLMGRSNVCGDPYGRMQDQGDQ